MARDGDGLLTAESASSSPTPTPAEASGPGRSLDPYRDWLGVTTSERPPSPYQLLNLRELETNPMAIAEAARAAKKTLRAYQIGQYRTEALALMTEIGQAADLLTNEEKKAAYDAQRRERLLTLARENFPQADPSRSLDDAFAEWLTGIEKAGLPIAQLLPDLMQWCLGRTIRWPKRGILNVPLPLGLWIYFEAAVVGQCVERGTLDGRREAVKQIQVALGISAALSRAIILDMARSPDSLKLGPLARLAAEQPQQVMQSWRSRLTSGEGGKGRAKILKPSSPAHRAMTALLGLEDESALAKAELVSPTAGGAGLSKWIAESVSAGGTVAERLSEAAGGHSQLLLAVKVAAIVSLVFLAGLLLLLVVGC
jgi:hypothetical protein